MEPKRIKLTTTTTDDDGAAVDRISNLPVPILHHILSLLPSIDVIRARRLSKTLHSAITSFPVIDLDFSWFNPHRLRQHLTAEFLTTVNRTTQRINLDNTHLQKLRIRPPKISDKKHANVIKKAINFAIENRVQELDIDLKHPKYSLPLTLIGSSPNFIVTLRLSGLKLHNLSVNELFEMSTSSWPVLENLSISNCAGLRNFRFLGSRRIKSIALEPSDALLKRVKIESVSLEKFEFVGVYRRLISNIKECDIDISGCPFLKMLSLSFIHFHKDWLEDNLENKLVHLEELRLEYYTTFKPVKTISSASLKKLVWVNMPGGIEIHAPNLESLTFEESDDKSFSIHPRTHVLKHLSYKRTWGIDCQHILGHCREQVFDIAGLKSLELEFTPQCSLHKFEINRPMKKSSSSSGMLEVIVKFPVRRWGKVTDSLLPRNIINRRGKFLEVVLLIDSEEKPVDKRHLITFWNWIASFGPVKDLTIDCHSVQDLVYPESFTLSQIYDLRTLTVKLLTWSPVSFALVNNFLRLSPNLETLRIVSTGHRNRSIEFEYGSGGGGEDDQTCCKRLSRKCWRHSLRKVVLINFGDVVDREKLVRFFPVGTKIEYK